MSHTMPKALSRALTQSNAIKLLTENEVSLLIKKSTAWLRLSRRLGDGIPYRKLGHSVRYAESDVLKWIEKHALQTSTSGEGI